MTNPEQAAAPAAIVTTPTEREIRIERVFDAPRDHVFATMTDPELIPEWWGPNGVTTVVDQMDFRPGGSWRFVMRHSDGSESGFGDGATCLGCVAKILAKLSTKKAFRRRGL